MALLLAMSASAQIYDGITQPTKYRLAVPTTVSIDNGATTVAPFFGYKCEATDWMSVTPILQYNATNNVFAPQVWLNFNVKNTFFLLSRSIYDCSAGKYRQGLAATVKLPLGFMIDCTWDNLFDGTNFVTSDRLQVVGGYAYSRVVFNMGYSMRGHPGFVANVRFKVTDLTWLQMKYDGGMNAVTIQSFFQI